MYYQVSDDDYILLEKIEVINDKDKVIKFWEDKLYVISIGPQEGIFEYQLKYENISKKEFNFETPKTSNFPNGLFIDTIEKLDANYIYFSIFTGSYENGHKSIKCSLNNYVCELDK